MGKNRQKTFVVINLAYIGDVMVCSALCEEIKKNYPESKLIFVTNNISAQVAEGIPSVDEVRIFDKKKEHRGLLGLLKFASAFKDVDVCFPVHSYDRGNLLAFLTGARRRISNKQEKNLTRFLLTDCLNTDSIHVVDRTLELVVPVTGKKPESSMNYRVKDEYSKRAFDMIKEQGYDKYELIALCTNTKNPVKDWNAKEAAEFIKLVNKSGRRVVWVGTSNSAEMAEEVENNIGDVFLNLINKTDIALLGGVLKNCKALVSVDTGTMHIGVAMKMPVVCLFFVPFLLDEWAPRDESFTRVILSEEGISASLCFEKLKELI